MNLKRVNRFFALLTPLVLAACFVGDAPMIADGEGEVLGTHALAFCTGDGCYAGAPLNDGYVVTNPDDPADPETMQMRLAPLWDDAAGTRVYLVEMAGEADKGVIYFVGRRLPDAPGRLDLQMPRCSLYGDAARERYRLKRIDSSSCSAPDLETLKAALIYLYADDFVRPDFWTE